MIRQGGGGGGGFGGFPYRSAHQQGQDGRGGRGRGRGRGRGGRGRQQHQRPRGNSNLSLQAELRIPPQQRGLIVGRGGSTLKWLRESSGANIFVPHAQDQQRQRQRRRRGRQQAQREGQQDGQQEVQQDTSASSANETDDRNTQQTENHPVRVNTFELSNLLHAFHEISSLMSKSTDISGSTGFFPCIVKMKSNSKNNQPPVDMKVSGELYISRHQMNEQDVPSDNVHTQSHLLFKGSIGSAASDVSSLENSQSTLCACSIQTELGEDDVITIIDNIRFVDASIDSCQWFYREVEKRSGNNSNDNIPSTTNNDDDKGNTPGQLARHGLVLVFGSESSKPELICQAVQEAAREG